MQLQLELRGTGQHRGGDLALVDCTRVPCRSSAFDYVLDKVRRLVQRRPFFFAASSDERSLSVGCDEFSLSAGCKRGPWWTGCACMRAAVPLAARWKGALARAKSITLLFMTLWFEQSVAVQGTLDALDCAGRAADALRKVARVRHLWERLA